MITRLQYVMLCRIERGESAFDRPAVDEERLELRRIALSDLYARRLILRGAQGPKISDFGAETLAWIRSPKNDVKPLRSNFIAVCTERTGLRRHVVHQRLTRIRCDVRRGREYEKRVDEIEQNSRRPYD